MSRRCAVLLLGLLACAPPVAQRPVDRSQLAKLEASVDSEGTPIGHAEGATLVVVFASWCPHCHKELDVIARLRPAHPALRVLGVNYRGHEEYGGRGNADAVKQYVAKHAPWLRVVPADDALFGALGSPPKIPTLYVFDRTGALVEIYSRTDRAMPDADELRELLRRIGV